MAVFLLLRSSLTAVPAPHPANLSACAGYLLGGERQSEEHRHCPGPSAASWEGFLKDLKLDWAWESQPGPFLEAAVGMGGVLGRGNSSALQAQWPGLSRGRPVAECRGKGWDIGMDLEGWPGAWAPCSPRSYTWDLSATRGQGIFQAEERHSQVLGGSVSDASSALRRLVGQLRQSFRWAGGVTELWLPWWGSS